MEINIITFKNPHLFWFFEVQNGTKRESIENELKSEKLVSAATVNLGEFVAIHDGRWKRAIARSTTSPYTCWLLDYGTWHLAKVVYKLPAELANKPPLVKQGALINTVCLKQIHTIAGVSNVEQLDFTIGCNKRTQDHIESARKLYFSCIKEVNSAHLGNITIIAKKTFDLTEMLVADKVLVQNKELFESAFPQNSKVDVEIGTSECSPQMKKFFYEEDFVTDGVGRGVRRVSPREAKKRVTAKKADLEQWVRQSKLSVNKEKIDFDFEDELADVSPDNSSSSTSQSSPQRVSLKHLKQAYTEVESSSNYSEEIDADKKLKDNTNVIKKSSEISWNDFRTENSQVNNHLNIPPSGMLLPTATKKSKGFKKQSPAANKSLDNSITSPSKEQETNLDNTATTTSKEQENTVSSASGSIKHNTKSPLGCNCEQCVGWSSHDLYFNENKKQFQDTANGKKIKEVVKPTLLLKEDEVQTVKIKSCVTPTRTKIKRSWGPTVLVHGTTFLSPVTTLSAVPFHVDIHKALREFEQVYSVQSYVWPALMRHMNICIIGNKNSGKTMAYLPGICTFELERTERYPDLPQNTISPLTVILCSGVRTAEKVFNTVLKLLEYACGKTYVALAVQPIDKNCLNQFQKQVHILVATPKTLTSLITTRIITLKRLCHFVVEDVDVSLEKFPQEIDNLLKLVQSMLKHRSCNYTVQMIVTAEQWTLPIEGLLKSLHVVPVVCMGSYLEAALYGRVDLQLHFIESKVKMSTLCTFLKGKAEFRRTMVLCNTNDEINAVKEYLLFSGVNCLYITDDMEAKDISDIESRWLHSSPGKHSALICVERVFSHSINITNAVMVIHYSLPRTWTQFIDRFRCLIDNYISPLTTDVPENWTRCKVHVFVDESCNKQFPKIVHVMERLGAKLPSNFQTYLQNIVDINETAKISAKTKICNNLRLFGKCSMVNCKNRHFLSNELDSVTIWPKNGVIKFTIMHVRDVTCFAIKLLELTDVDGKLTKYNLHENLDERLQEAMKVQKNYVYDAKPGNRYVYQSTNDRYYRCVVRKIVSAEKITKKASVVSIRCLDTGLESDVPCSSLYELPNALSKINPQVVDVFIANLVPPDLDFNWSYYSKTKVDRIVESAECGKEDTYAVGQIQLQLGNALWLKNIMVYEVLKSTNLTVNKLNLRKRLLDENLAIVDEAQLEGLYKSCADANIELPDYNLPVAKDSEIGCMMKQAKPQWSYFDDNLESIEIFIAYVETPSVFYVRLKKYYDLFRNLQEEIQEAIAKPFYPAVTDVCLDRCYLAKDPEGDEYARVVIKEIVGEFVKVFFVDYGDYATVDKTELKYIPDELITKLPFQVIECRLYGVEPIYDQWDLSANRTFFDFVFEPNTDYFRTLYTTSCKQEPTTVTGGLKYAVLLVDNFQNNITIINKLLIDIEKAVPVKDEDINLQFSLPTAVEELVDAVSDITDDKEMTVEEINNMQKKYGAKVEVVQATAVDNGPSWDIEINDAESFLKQFVKGGRDETPSTSATTNWEYPPIQALPPSSYSTPNILWHQTNTEIRINIMLPNVNVCDLQVVRGKMLMFSTTYNDKPYKLSLNFFDDVEKNFQYTLGGPHIKVSLKKKAEAEWPRLIVTSQKKRFIKYDISQCNFKEEKKKLFLDLGLAEDLEVPDGVVHEIGSDENYSESDYESDYED